MGKLKVITKVKKLSCRENHKLQMRICTWNVRGLGSKTNRSVIRHLLADCGADIIILQETKKNWNTR